MKVSACVPCFNNESTVAATIASIASQATPVSEVLVIDDGSNDGSADVARASGAHVIAQGRNLGRGAARARGMEEAHHDCVLWLDATATISSDFLTRALTWFEETAVAGVCGQVDDPDPTGIVGRWRARHLFRQGSAVGSTRGALLATGGCLLRRDAVLAVGNFNQRLRHGEDADLGYRLLKRYDLVFDRTLRVITRSPNTIGQALDRYWRWNSGLDENVNWSWYPKLVSYSIRVMARQDLAARDPGAVPLSLVAPHYQFWRTFGRRYLRNVVP